MTVCAVKGCRSNPDKNKIHSNITFHVFPADPLIASRWTKQLRLNRSEPTWKPTKQTRICSNHFDDSDKYLTKKGLHKLRRDAIPHKLPVFVHQVTEEEEQQEEQDELKQIETTSDVINANLYSWVDVPHAIFDSPNCELGRNLKKDSLVARKNAKKIKMLQQKTRRLTRRNEILKTILLNVRKKRSSKDANKTADAKDDSVDPLFLHTPLIIKLNPEKPVRKHVKTSSPILRACRACLTVEKKLYHIESNSMAEAFEVVTGLELDQNTDLPQHLCSYCYAMINKCIQFRMQCQRNEELMVPLAESGKLSVDWLNHADIKPCRVLVQSQLEVLEVSRARAGPGPVVSESAPHDPLGECDWNLEIAANTEIANHRNMKTEVVDSAQDVTLPEYRYLAVQSEQKDTKPQTSNQKQQPLHALIQKAVDNTKSPHSDHSDHSSMMTANNSDQPHGSMIIDHQDERIIPSDHDHSDHNDHTNDTVKCGVKRKKEFLSRTGVGKLNAIKDKKGLLKRWECDVCGEPFVIKSKTATLLKGKRDFVICSKCSYEYRNNLNKGKCKRKMKETVVSTVFEGSI